MIQPFRVLIIDDHRHAREAMRIIIGQDPLFEIVGEGSDGMEALRITEETMPDLLLMDIQMKGMDGLEATKEIKAKFPYVKIVIVTVSDEALNLFDALKKGASGYLLKNLNPSSWLDYLKAVMFDDVPLSKDFADQLLKEMALRHDKASIAAQITTREREILHWVAQGASNREIAEQLFIAENTVKNHMKNILHKLELENRVQLTRFAIENNIVHDR